MLVFARAVNDQDLTRSVLQSFKVFCAQKRCQDLQRCVKGIHTSDFCLNVDYSDLYTAFLSFTVSLITCDRSRLPLASHSAVVTVVGVS